MAANLDTKLKQLQAAFDIGALDEVQFTAAQKSLMERELSNAQSVEPEPESTSLDGTDGTDGTKSHRDADDGLAGDDLHECSKLNRPAAVSSPRRSMKAAPAQFSSWLDMEVGSLRKRWERRFFVLRNDVLKCYREEIESPDTEFFSVAANQCVLRLPKNFRKGRENTFRIDSTDKRKFILDTGMELTSENLRATWFGELGASGGNIPGEWEDFVRMAQMKRHNFERLIDVDHGINAGRKGWLNMKQTGVVKTWKGFWFEHDCETGILSWFERPGANAKGHFDLGNFEVNAGRNETEQRKLDMELGQEYVIELLQLATGQHHLLSADSPQELVKWIAALTHRRYHLTRLEGASSFGFTFDEDSCVMIVNSEHGAAGMAGITSGQTLVAVNARAVTCKTEAMTQLLVANRDENVKAVDGSENDFVDQVELWVQGLGTIDTETLTAKTVAAMEEAEAQASDKDRERSMKLIAAKRLAEEREAQAAAEEAERQRLAWEEEESARLEQARVEEAERARLEAARVAAEQAEFERNFAEIIQVCQTLTGKDAQATAQLLSSGAEGRNVLKSGLLLKQGDARKQERFFILLSDVFLFTKQEQKRGKIVRDVRRVIHADELKDATMTSFQHTKVGPDRWGFGLDIPGYDTELYAADEPEAEDWKKLHVVLCDLNSTSLMRYGSEHLLLKGTMHHAAATGCVDFVRRVGTLDNSNRPDDFNGSTPLHLAAFYGHTEALHALVDAGADVDAADAKGQTPGHLAAQAGHTAILAALAQLMVDFNAFDTDGRSTLQVRSMSCILL
eukprot:SAG31_NODE_1607_length_7760_cov_3.640386_1_plen_793_part_00